MKNEEINQQEESEKKEWNAPQINELGVDKTESGWSFYHSEAPSWAQLQS